MLKSIKTTFRQTYRDFRTMVQWRLRGYAGIDPHAYIIGPAQVAKDVKMGAFCHLSPGCSIGSNVVMKNYVMCGPEVMIAMGDHRFDLPGTPVIFSGRGSIRQTIIEDDVWIGARSLIRSGVRIGRGSIIAMGAVVTRDVEPFSVVAGVPARKVKNRFSSSEDRTAHEQMLMLPPRRGVYCEQ